MPQRTARDRAEVDQRSNPLNVSTKRLQSSLADTFVTAIVLVTFWTATPRLAGALFHTDDLLLVQTRSERAPQRASDDGNGRTEFMLSSCGSDKIRTRTYTTASDYENGSYDRGLVFAVQIRSEHVRTPQHQTMKMAEQSL